ncbi:MAG: hypothetical protein IJ610_03705 [Bacteroidaceae bacterium]|nr:hypothetical protein [Bacteroidaceae bacterium]
MTQDELWEQNYRTFIDFMTTQNRRPSKHRLEEHQMLNWLKYQKKSLAQGKLKPERIEKFLKLLEIAGLYLRKNQYAYASQEDAGNGFYDDLFKRTT